MADGRCGSVHIYVYVQYILNILRYLIMVPPQNIAQIPPVDVSTLQANTHTHTHTRLWVNVIYLHQVNRLFSPHLFSLAHELYQAWYMNMDPHVWFSDSVNENSLPFLRLNHLPTDLKDWTLKEEHMRKEWLQSH